MNPYRIKFSKRILPLMAALLLGIFWVQAKETAKMSVEEKVYDFGQIARNKPVSHEFEFSNDGDANLVILKATAECGCTKPDYPQAPVPPGKKGRVKVTFNPSQYRGPFSKQVTLRTNGNPKNVRLTIKGSVAE